MFKSAVMMAIVVRSSCQVEPEEHATEPTIEADKDSPPLSIESLSTVRITHSTRHVCITKSPQPVSPLSMGTVNVVEADGSPGIPQVVRQKQGDVKSCYEQRLKVKPDLSGHLWFDFSVEGGQVKDVSLTKNTTGDTALKSCVMQQIRSWRFASDVDSYVIAPFLFSSADHSDR
ncbi:MAG: AgmX/PglI C-terminal domain-containing protein [Myxococcota bacterium]